METIQLGGYEVVGRLGVGGMGEVYRARQMSLEREVALKILPVERTASPVLLERFRREVRIQSSLSHPNLVKVFDCGVDRGVPFIAMELVEGRTLKQLLAESGPVPVADARRMIAQIAEGLDHLHENGVVHRDLKPANVLVSSAGMVKVSDFGLARGALSEEVTVQGKVVGTPEYLAPETIVTRRSGPEADLHGLGLIAYELLAGRLPYSAPSRLELMKVIVEAVPTSLREIRSDVAPDLDRLVLELLRKEPAGRPTARQVVDRLGGAGGRRGGASVAGSAGEGRVPGRPVRSGWRRALLWGPGFMAVLLAGALLQRVRMPDIARRPPASPTPAPAPDPGTPGDGQAVSTAATAGRLAPIHRELLPGLHRRTLDLVHVPGGRFSMGAIQPEADGFRRHQVPVRELTVPPFYIGRHEVTGGQFADVMAQPPGPAEFSNHPVSNITWGEARIFCRRLSEITNREFRLPSEAEWEYACRAGTRTLFYFGSDPEVLGRHAWLGLEGTHPVGRKLPNGFGLYDMYGNVWEWCADGWHANFEGAPPDARPWIDPVSTIGVLRGGGSGVNPVGSPSSSVRMSGTAQTAPDWGFRVVMEVPLARDPTGS